MMRFALGAKCGRPTGDNNSDEPPPKRSFTNNDPRATLPMPRLSLPRKCFLVMFILFSKNSFAICFTFFHRDPPQAETDGCYYAITITTTINFGCIALLCYNNSIQPLNVEPLRGSFKISFIQSRG